MRNKIKELRKQTGLRQEDMAKELGVTRQTINAIENDKYNPTLCTSVKHRLHFCMLARSHGKAAGVRSGG